MNTKLARTIISRCWPWIVLAMIITFVGVIRIRLLQIPLERDEGEYAYMGQLMLQGIPPYLQAYNMKLPGIYAAYALVMALFGQTIAGIHLGLMLVNGAAIVLLFLLTRRLFDNLAGVVAAASYGVLSLSPFVFGTSAHATQFIVPFAVGATLLLLMALDSQRYRQFFWAGLLYGVAFILKQHAVFFIAFAIVYTIYRGFPPPHLTPHPGPVASPSRRRGKESLLTRRAASPLPQGERGDFVNYGFLSNFKKLAASVGLLTLGSATPFILTCAMLYALGVFSNFWFWTFSYARQYVAEVSLHCAIPLFRSMARTIIGPWVSLWVPALIGLTAVFWNRKARQNAPFLIGFALTCFLTICPGFFFRPHYFVTFLPAIALLAAVCLSAMMQFMRDRKMFLPVQIVLLLVATVAIIGPAFVLLDFYLRATPVQICRVMYGENPFTESIELAEYIKNHTTKDDKIAVIGSEPQICFYANRKSATGYIYAYGLMEPQEYASRMQREMMHEIEIVHPKYIVFVNVHTSWGLRPLSDTIIFNWATTYLGMNYRLAGFVDIFPRGDCPDGDYRNGRYQVYWDEEARKNVPRSQFNVFVLEKKEWEAGKWKIINSPQSTLHGKTKYEPGNRGNGVKSKDQTEKQKSEPRPDGDGMGTLVNAISSSLKDWPRDLERLLNENHLCACVNEL